MRHFWVFHTISLMETESVDQGLQDLLRAPGVIGVAIIDQQGVVLQSVGDVSSINAQIPILMQNALATVRLIDEDDDPQLLKLLLQDIEI